MRGYLMAWGLFTFLFFGYTLCNQLPQSPESFISTQAQWWWYVRQHGPTIHYVVSYYNGMPPYKEQTVSLCIPQDGVHSGGACPIYFPNAIAFAGTPWSP